MHVHLNTAQYFEMSSSRPRFAPDLSFASIQSFDLISISILTHSQRYAQGRRRTPRHKPVHLRAQRTKHYTPSLSARRTFYDYLPGKTIFGFHIHACNVSTGGISPSFPIRFTKREIITTLVASFRCRVHSDLQSRYRLKTSTRE